MDTTEISLLFSLYPVILVFIAWYMLRGRKQTQKAKKEFFFLLIFLALAIFYIMAPDPSLIQKLYVEGGDFKPILVFSTVSAVALFIAVYYGKKHMETPQ